MQTKIDHQKHEIREKFSDYKYVTKKQVEVIKTLANSLKSFDIQEVVSVLLSLGD